MNMLTELFFCPKCHGLLEFIPSRNNWVKTENDLICTLCQQFYPVINGIPFLIDLHSTGWITIQRAYYIWQQTDKNISFKLFFEHLQKYSNSAYGNYDELIFLSHAIASNDSYDFYLHTCNDPDIIPWNESQDKIYDWVFNEVLNNLKSDEIILDVGVGGATVENYLAENTKNTVIGMDISPHELFLFRNKLPKERVILTCGDFCKSPLKDNSIDIIVNTGGFQHIDHFAEALMEFYRVLKKGGRIVMMAFHNLPQGNLTKEIYHEVDVPIDGIELLNRFKNSGFELVNYEDNIGNHSNYKQYGAVLIKK